MRKFISPILFVILLAECSCTGNTRSLILSDSAVYYADDDLTVEIPAGMPDGGSEPAILKSVNPKYPSEALREGIEGDVLVKMLVMADGRPKRAMIAESTNPIFNRESLLAAIQYTFAPAVDLDSTKRNVWVVIPFRFRLRVY